MTTVFLCLCAFTIGYLIAHRRIETLTTQRDNALVSLWQTQERLAVSNIVCDTLADDLGEALHLAPSETPLHDEVVVDLFRRQLDKGWQA